MISKIGTVVAFSVALIGGGLPAFAQDAATPNTIEYYEPGVWIDPDGCAHWVMDDGAEGYMSPVRRRNGSAVCGAQQSCKALDSDQYFGVDNASISAEGASALEEFFKTNGSVAYAIYGHTDSTASAEYNNDLSLRRARAVAEIARSVGARIVDVRGYGESRPIASNETTGGRSKNRRVDIACVR